jgi:hypothetical protein
MRAVTVKDYFGLPPWEHNGQIGIEIEMEGDGLTYPDMSNGKVVDYWFAKEDGSMKGPGLEYYLKVPVTREEVRPALKWLQQFWKNTKAKLQPSECDAVHVHLNCRDLMLDQAMCVILLMVLLEDLLVRWCGESREGNLFCLRSRDAENFLSVLRNILIKKEFGTLNQDYLKYSAINIAPLACFGSVEVRCMQTPKDISLVAKWVDMLCCVYDAALKLQNIRDVVDVLAYRSSDALLYQIFGDLSEELMFYDTDKLLADGRDRVREVVYSAHIYKERKKNKTLIAPPRTRKIAEKQYIASGSAGSGGLVFNPDWAAVVDDSTDNFWSQPSATQPPMDTEVIDPLNYISKFANGTIRKYLASVPGYYIYYHTVKGKQMVLPEGYTSTQIMLMFNQGLGNESVGEV